MQLRLVTWLAFSLCSPVGTHPSLADSKPLSNEHEIPFYFQGRGAGDLSENQRLSKTLVSSLKKILENPFFKNFHSAAAPAAAAVSVTSPVASFGIIIDGDWTKSEGYFSPELKTPTGAPAILIQRPALYNEGALPALLTHELTHLLHWQKRPLEETWIQEGLALLAEYLVTRNFNRALLSGFSMPETSLTEGFDFHLRTPDNREQTLAQYGHALQYFYYLYRVCGKDALVEKLLTSDSKKTGIEFMDEVLGEFGKNQTPDPVCSSFEKSFVSFEKARFFPEVTPPSAYVVLANLKAQVRETPSALAPQSTTVPPYSARAFTLPAQDFACENGFFKVKTRICFQIQAEAGKFLKE